MTGEANDLFDDVSDLAIKLASEGAEERAEAISGAVRYSSTGSEILTNLGRELSLLLKDKSPTVSKDTRAAAERLLKQVNKLLRGN